jgi:hypothetical protein
MNHNGSRAGHVAEVDSCYWRICAYSQGQADLLNELKEQVIDPAEQKDQELAQR